MEEIIKEATENTEEGAPIEEILRKAKEKNMEGKEIKKGLHSLRRKGDLVEEKPGYLKLV